MACGSDGKAWRDDAERYLPWPLPSLRTALAVWHPSACKDGAGKSGAGKDGTGKDGAGGPWLATPQGRLAAAMRLRKRQSKGLLI